MAASLIRAEDLAMSSLPAAPAQAAPALFHQALIAEKHGDHETAHALCLEILAKDPANARALETLRRNDEALLRKKTRSFERQRNDFVREAQKRLDKQAVRGESRQARIAEGGRLVEKQRYLEASDVYNRVLEESPGHPQASKGIQKVQRALARQLKRGRFPEPSYFHATQGIHAYNKADWPTALAGLQKIVKLNSLPEELVRARVPEYAARARTNLEQEYWRAERQNLFHQATLAAQAGRNLDARDLLRRIASRDPQDKEAADRLAGLEDSLMREQKVQETKTADKEIAERMQKGQRLYAQSRYTDALLEFARVLELDPEHKEARRQLKSVRADMKSAGIFVPSVAVEDAAEKQYREGLRLYGDEQVSEAQKAFEQAVKLNPDHEEARSALEKLGQQKRR